jgi:2-keto-4-pentenoate hydratase/2-oxohepta-3-ene-1,7-dioic acid hydratase in catechol pathway
MKLVTFLYDGLTIPGALVDSRVIDLSVVAPSMLDLIVTAPRESLLLSKANQARTLALADVQLLSPIPIPRRNIFCIGKNYAGHAREFQSSGFDASAGGEIEPTVPIVFTKATTAVIGTGAPIPGYLDPTQSLDYEGELAVVIGRGGRNISRNTAMEHIYGYTIINDVTSRTIQQAHKQWFLGKSIDGFCPMGPTLVTASEIPDPTKLHLETRVNGELRQQANLSDLIFDIPSLIEALSRGISLLPGDIIATGTPEGVGIGFRPPKFLRTGDVVEITISPIGTISNAIA